MKYLQHTTHSIHTSRYFVHHIRYLVLWLREWPADYALPTSVRHLFKSFLCHRVLQELFGFRRYMQSLNFKIVGIRRIRYSYRPLDLLSSRFLLHSSTILHSNRYCYTKSRSLFRQTDHKKVSTNYNLRATYEIRLRGMPTYRKYATQDVVWRGLVQRSNSCRRCQRSHVTLDLFPVLVKRSPCKQVIKTRPKGAERVILCRSACVS
ncbi:hypothetical protein F5Y14DRAFT_177033 [Nemania sp. NC0429]|nr:hypothetical protein F5Y14DRAFT_177033 [Nemania sp. NC0429]